MPLFFHDVVLHNDPDGLGIWLLEHYQEHLQFVRMGLQQTPIQNIPDLDIAIMSQEPERREEWLSSHMDIHENLRNWTNVQGVDLATVDFDNSDSWFLWMDAHAQEHRAIRSALNIS
jgi:hypothetical protein